MLKHQQLMVKLGYLPLTFTLLLLQPLHKGTTLNPLFAHLLLVKLPPFKLVNLGRHGLCSLLNHGLLLLLSVKLLTQSGKFF